ncbi:MAG: glutamate-cysteine ligase family protein [Proteobacteria bacterium]|nr:glutamate-cysteine ligase family protein [Pseudomonadota bacterium]
MPVQKFDSDLKMTPQLCWEFLEQKTFRLQPQTYQEAHPEWPGAVGLEIEMLPLHLSQSNPSSAPRLVPLQGDENCLAHWLRDFASEFGFRASDSSGLLMNVFLDEDDNLSFEPGGQLEFSSKPYECLSQATLRTQNIQALLDRELWKRGQVTLTQVGLNPWHSVDEIGLQMRKPRYQAMNDFFSAISPYGPRMMRQTCTVQVNLDFGKNEETMAKRYLASMLLAPFSGAVFNYSAFSSQAYMGMTGLRSKVWRHMDPTRTGVPNLKHLKEKFSKAACVQTYFDFLMNARVVFVTGLDYKVMHKPTTWAEWMQYGIDGTYPNFSDFETHLSLLFPEVRARGFLELRSVDCQSRVWQFVPAAWWTGLLYDSKACEQVIELLLPFENRMTEFLDAAPFGLTHVELARLSKSLMELSIYGISRLPKCYFGQGAKNHLEIFADRFTARGRVPASDIVDTFNKRGHLDLRCFTDNEDGWRQLLGS